MAFQLPRLETVAKEAEFELSAWVRGDQEVLIVVKAVYDAINRCTGQVVTIEVPAP